MTLTDLQRQRLDAAVSALREAGAEKLPGMLEGAFAGDDHDERSTVMRQARVWSAIEGRRSKEGAATRDAVGLLWAVAEDGP